MLYVYGFERICVAVSDIYFVDPQPGKGQEGAEHGVRLEVRAIEEGPLKGTIYSARPISVEQPIWRADLLESVDGRPGSFDRTHHHPTFSGWDPGPRVFAKELSGDPLGWLANRLSDLEGVVKEAQADVDTSDAEALREAVPEIVDTVERLLVRVRAGELGTAPEGASGSVRASWL
ncbi:hypothetical protein [Nonomuraea rhizosphaerae]|uniref:hypothetical protein n=1 Tax=Nonomuraea rhizosphaerae TaxID=2665663 RepID=UPI001C5F2DD5|nr:hypothetical protein [Nonomuraea rhizosphaerae]